MRAIDTITYSNISATPANFEVSGGDYAALISGTFGTAQLNVLSPDGTTLVPATASPWTSNTLTILKLARGFTYQLTLSEASAIYFEMQRVPGE